MKEYIDEFYNNGLGYFLIVKPQNFINKHIKNKTTSKVLMLLIKILYTILSIAIMIMIIYKKWPF